MMTTVLNTLLIFSVCAWLFNVYMTRRERKKLETEICRYQAMCDLLAVSTVGSAIEGCVPLNAGDNLRLQGANGGFVDIHTSAATVITVKTRP